MKSLLFSFLLVGCIPNIVSHEEMNDARIQARQNVKLLAMEYRLRNGLFLWGVYPQTDATISRLCPMGSGWADVELRRSNEVMPLKCSTYSEEIGCITELDFIASRKKLRCNRDIPFPIRDFLQ